MSVDDEKADELCQLANVLGYVDVGFCKDLGGPVMYVTNRPWPSVFEFLHSWSIRTEDHNASITMIERSRKTRDEMWSSANKRCCKGDVP